MLTIARMFLGFLFSAGIVLCGLLNFILFGVKCKPVALIIFSIAVIIFLGQFISMLG